MVSPPLWQPVLPHDDAGLETWRQSHNVGRTSDRRRVFVHAVREAVAMSAVPGQPRRALDIGCGWGIGDDPVIGAEYLAGIRDCVDELWGVEPDESVCPAHGMLDRMVVSTLEDANLPAAYFDVAYAYYVLEHVSDPDRFLRAAAQVLRPGGRLVLMTPNGGHWFSRAAGLTRRLRLDHAILGLLRGREARDAYHYEAIHTANHPDLITRVARSSGFATPTFAYFDHGDLLPYLPRPLRPAVARWELRRARQHAPVGLLAVLERVGPQ